MSPSDRLEELKRQRAQLMEQLAKVDQELVAAAALATETESKKPRPEAADPNQVLQQFADAPENPAEVKRGCVTAFIWAMVVMTAALVAIYYVFYR